MRFTTPITMTALMLLAACGKSGDGSAVSMKNASLEDVAKSQKQKIQPGEWAVKVEMVDQKVTGGPKMPDVPKQPPITTNTCITQTQVDKPEGMLSGGMGGLKKDCTYDNFEMADGKISARMHCAMQGGMKIEATNSGTFSATEITSDSNSTVSGLPGGMTTSSHTRMTAKRIGECTPSSTGTAPAGNAAG